MAAPLLTDFTLARFRAIQEGNMLSTVDLYAFASTRSPGGVTSRAPVLQATVPCRLSVLSSATPIIAAQPTPQVAYVLTVPALTDVSGIERVIVHGTTQGQSWSAEMVVTGTDEPRTYSASKRLNVRLAPDSMIAVPLVGSVIVSEA